MKLPIAYYGDPLLRKKSMPIDCINDEIRQLVADMITTCRHYNGVGLAAPQVKHLLTLFIAYGATEGKWDLNKMKVFINPKIISYSDVVHFSNEGCLSIPKVYGDVVRPTKVIIKATDLNGKEFTEEFENLEANVVLHENDHLNGVLFIDRLDKKQRKAIEPSLKEIKKKFRSNE